MSFSVVGERARRRCPSENNAIPSRLRCNGRQTAAVERRPHRGVPRGAYPGRRTSAWTSPARSGTLHGRPPPRRANRMIRWTGFVIAHRGRILAVWLVLFVLGGFAAANLGGLLSNRFSVPGRGVRARPRPAQGPHGRPLRRRVHARRRPASTARPSARRSRPPPRARRARAVDGGKAGPLLPAAPRRGLRCRSRRRWRTRTPRRRTPELRARDRPRAGRRGRTSPAIPAINHDTQTIFSEDLARGESIAIPIALLVMVFMFGTLGGIVVPGRVRGDDDPDDARVRVDLRPHDGHGDLRDEHRRADRAGDRGRLLDARRVPLPRGARAAPTTCTRRCRRRWRPPAGRRCSPAAIVAIGLALLVFMPLPFMRSMGVGGLLVPLVSIAASATLLPALLAHDGPRREPLAGHPAARSSSAARGRGRDRRSGTASRRRSCAARCCSSRRPAALMLALARPRARARADRRRQPRRAAHDRVDARAARAPDDARRRARSRRTRSWSTRTGRAARATRRSSPPSGGSSAELRARSGDRCRGRSPRRSLVPPRGARQANLRRRRRAASCRSAPPGRTDAGTQPAIDLVDRIRDRYVPAARFPGGAEVLADAARPRSASTSSTRPTARSRGSCSPCSSSPTCCSLRAFRSVVLPAKAVIMNLLSVSATYGVLVLAFQHGWGEPFGLQQYAADRRLDPDLPVRRAVRPVDGLRGVPALAHPRGVGPPPRQRARRSPTGSSTPGASSRRPRSS